ncbi:MAG: ATPase, partial [Pseudomonadota bacterium]
ATQVDVRFTQTEAGTRVELTHSGFEALGDAAVAQHTGYTSGWDPVLYECFAGCCEAVAA